LDPAKLDSSPLVTRRLALLSFIVFLIFACVFVLFRSRDPLAADGSFRCFEVFRRQTLFFHGSNHMLYPVNVLLWTRLTAAVGLHVGDPPSFFYVTELMNCFAAAACLALFFILSSLVSRSWRLAATVTAVYGLSKAFLLHATNASEPMVGIFWSFLAVAAAALSLKTKSLWPAFFSGLLFALAMATYQSAVLLGPAALFVVWRSRSAENQIVPRPRSRFMAVLVFGLGAIIGCSAIYGWSVYLQGKRQPTGSSYSAVAAQIFQHPDARAFFGVTMAKFATVPVGLVRNIFPILPEFIGLRSVLRGSFLPILVLAFLLLAIGILIAFCAVCVSKSWNSLSRASRTAFVAGVLGLFFSLIPVVTWSDQYDKLWLQPLACLCLLLGLSLHWISQQFPSRLALARGVAVLALAGVLLNFGWLETQHVLEIPEMREVQRLASMMRPSDLVVGDWDGVSTLYGYGWAADGQLISFPSEAVYYGSEATSRLRDAVLKTQNAGGRVFFLSILDTPKVSWDSFLASRCGVPYSALDLYRAHSLTRATFTTRVREIALKQYETAP
jgi:hypothetical protein